MIKNNLKKIRETRGLTKRAMADLLEIKSSCGEYAALENGTRKPKVDKAIRIARALKTRVENIWIIN